MFFGSSKISFEIKIILSWQGSWRLLVQLFHFIAENIIEVRFTDLTRVAVNCEIKNKFKS